MARTVVLLVGLTAATIGLSALEVTLGPAALGDAIAIGQSRALATHEQLHATYHVDVSRPPVDYLEIVTPFRRVVLDAETNNRLGQRLYGQREALAALGNDPTRVDIVVELSFHPQNTFVGVPSYTVVLQPIDPNDKDVPRVLPSRIDRIPRFGPRVTQNPLTYPYSASGILPNLSQPLLGGRLVAAFDARTLTMHPQSKVSVLDGNQELAVVTLDVRGMR